MEISETMQEMDPASKLQDGSTRVAAPDEHILQNNAVGNDHRTKQASSQIPTAATDQFMQHSTDMDIDKHGLQKNEQGSRLAGVDQTVENVRQQLGDVETNNHSQIAAPVDNKEVETIADKSAEGDGAHSAGNLTQEEEGSDIQEDDLINSVIEVFEARHLIETRPIPVLVKGKEVDLVQLSFQVRACGGYSQVTLWTSISKTLGFGAECGPLLKLVYVKYLKSLEHRRLIANQAVQGSQSVSKKETEDNVKSESVKSQSKGRGVSSTRKRTSEDGSTVDNTVTDSGAALFADGSESLSGVLDWIKRLALNPGDPKKGQGIRVSRWSEAWAGRCETLAARMREVLWKKHEHPLHDLSPSESQDQELERRKRGRGQCPRAKGVGKKAHRLSS